MVGTNSLDIDLTVTAVHSVHRNCSHLEAYLHICFKEGPVAEIFYGFVTMRSSE